MDKRQSLHFVPLKQTHLEDLHQINQDSELRKYLMEEMEMTIEDSQSVISANEAFINENSLGLFLVRSEDDWIGYCGFRKAFEDDQAIDLMYALKGKYFGQGFGTQILNELMKRHRSSGSKKKVTAVTHPLNTASNKILERAGFKNLGPAPGKLNHLIGWEE